MINRYFLVLSILIIPLACAVSSGANSAEKAAKQYFEDIKAEITDSDIIISESELREIFPKLLASSNEDINQKSTIDMESRIAKWSNLIAESLRNSSKSFVDKFKDTTWVKYETSKSETDMGLTLESGKIIYLRNDSEETTSLELIFTGLGWKLLYIGSLNPFGILGE